MYGWQEIPGALVRLLEADLAAGEFFEHLSDEQRGALLQGGGTGADWSAQGADAMRRNFRRAAFGPLFYGRK